MKNLLILLLLFTFGITYSQVNCRTYSENYIPKNINSAIKYLDCTWPESDKDEFKNKEESEAVSGLHFGTGQGIRNGWGLWKGKNQISRFFKSKGIDHPDDMSAIVLTSFHRHLNNKPINLNDQIKYYKAYWERASMRIKEKEKLIEIEFNSFSVGDSVKIAFRKEINIKDKLKVYRVQRHESAEEMADCYFVGIITDKKNKKRMKYNDVKRIRGIEKYILTVSVNDFCGYDKGVFSSNAMFYKLNDTIEKNKEYDFSLEHFIIEKLN